MALMLKRLFQSYFWAMEELSDPRALDYPLMFSPFPTIFILFLWFKFILQWGPDYMKNREPINLKTVMMVYNIFQVAANSYIVYYVFLAKDVISLSCMEVDYSNSYWGLKFLSITYLYFMLKLADLLDTIFFVLRKKTSHLSFLHIYHHFGMVCISWLAMKFIGGGHNYYVALANAPVHIILYSYYLLTAYDSKYGKHLWLKKFITQAQLVQFAFLLLMFGQLLFNECNFPKIVPIFFIPQNLFMMCLFGDFYIRTYIMIPKQKEKLQNKDLKKD
ncbi:very long chain fatty acid elongase AAEL008004-like [Euwallacea similis]|uniref:very long chain fatty acid elongase AAEL008004-like n=1 Tax=Euwallacea similis TaxID=1736056 RepID=UPI00344B9865